MNENQAIGSVWYNVDDNGFAIITSVIGNSVALLKNGTIHEFMWMEDFLLKYYPGNTDLI